MLPLSILLRASAYLAFGLGVFGMLLAVGPNLAEAEQDGTKSPFETSGPTLIDGKVVRDGGSKQENSGAQPAAGGDSLSPDGGTAVESGALGPDQTPALRLASSCKSVPSAQTSPGSSHPAGP